MKDKRNILRVWRALVHQKAPILSTVLYGMTYLEEEDVSKMPFKMDTFCMNPSTLTITYSKSFAESNTPETNAYILAHESAHYLLEHIDRRHVMMRKEGCSFEFVPWILAEDCVVNDLVTQLTGWKAPRDSVAMKSEWRGMTTEEIYYEIKKLVQPPPKSKPCNCIDPRSKPGQASSPAAEALKAQLQESAAKELKESIDSGKLQPGNLPGELRELALRFAPLKRPPDWKQLLKRYLTDSSLDCKYLDPSTLYRRRLSIDNLCLPNLASQPAAKKFVVSIDNSGSVSDEMFSCLCGVIDSVAHSLGFQEIVVQHFTTEVMATEKVLHIKGISNIKRKASGGTMLGDCDKKAADHHGQFHVILTDGYVDWLESYSLPTIIVRTVKDTTEPPMVRNLVGSVIADKNEAF